MNERLALDGGTPVRTRPFGPTHDYGEEEIAALTEVIQAGRETGNLGGGGKVKQFEREFAARHGVEYAIAVNSGTSAVHTCVAAINPDPGDEIIVTPWTAGGSIMGLLMQNCVPVFADIDDSYNIDPNDVEAKITPRTRAIIAVHVNGNPCDMSALREIANKHGLYLIEDAAQAHFAEYQGQMVGTLGDINAFAFGGGKHLSAGMGGAVLTSNLKLWERAKLFYDGGHPRDDGPYAGRPYANYILSLNYRINDLIGAVLVEQLKKLDGYLENKIRAARNIMTAVADIDELVPQKLRPGDRHTYWTLRWSIDTDRLNCSAGEFADAVRQEGITVAMGPYRSGSVGPLYRNPLLSEPDCYGQSHFPFNIGRDKPIDYRKVSCPYGEELMSRTFGVSMRPNFDEEDVEDIAAAIRKVAVHYRDRVLAAV